MLNVSRVNSSEQRSFSLQLSKLSTLRKSRKSKQHGIGKLSQHQLLKLPELGVSWQWRNKTGESEDGERVDLWHSSSVMLQVWLPGKHVMKPRVSWGPWKAGVKMLFEETDSRAAPGVPPPPDRMWLRAFQVWFLGKSPGCAGISTGETTGMVPGISYTPVCKCITWEPFLSRLAEPQGTESGTGASQRGAGLGDKSSRVLPHLFHLCLHLTAVGTFWRSNYTGTRSRWAFLVLPAHLLPTYSVARS